MAPLKVRWPKPYRDMPKKVSMTYVGALTLRIPTHYKLGYDYNNNNRYHNEHASPPGTGSRGGNLRKTPTQPELNLKHTTKEHGIKK